MTTARQLDLMSYREKTLHWMRPDCWKPNGARLRFEQPKRPVHVSTDLKGNVTFIRPLLAGRPCFGIVTAFERYKDAMKPVKGRGLLPATRCADCKAREACERVVKERVAAFPPLTAAFKEWLLAEGPSKFDTRDFERTHVGRLWRRVGLAAADASFTSVNDAKVVEHYQKLDKDALERDRRRKAIKREQDRRTGTIDAGHRSDLEIAADTRLIEVLEAIDAPHAPRILRALPPQSLEDMRDVWLGRETLRAERKKCRAPDVARWIQSQGRRNVSATFAALCTRVSKDLHRIENLGRVTWRDTPLMRPFDVDRESWSQLFLTIDRLNPLETAAGGEQANPLENATAVANSSRVLTPQTCTENLALSLF